MQANYVIVGAGSAGCAMAYRLSQSGASVIVIEHGGTDAGPFIQMPGALSYPMNMPLYDWGYSSEPEPHLNGRKLATPRGRVLGGSSSINGMVYVRGHARDFDHWRDAGADGWSYADVLPYFKRMEHGHGGRGKRSAWRGHKGPLHITRGPRDNPLHAAFVEAGVEAGYPVSEDYNGAQQEGFGAMEQTVWRGRRWSAANAYLRPALKSGNCKVIRGLATRVIVEEGRATGVEVLRGAAVEVIHAAREVILAASSINSPKLLMLSGIGPAAHLSEHGIEVISRWPRANRSRCIAIGTCLAKRLWARNGC
jgi:choline dehydrogenase